MSSDVAAGQAELRSTLVDAIGVIVAARVVLETARMNRARDRVVAICFGLLLGAAAGFLVSTGGFAAGGALHAGRHDFLYVPLASLRLPEVPFREEPKLFTRAPRCTKFELRC